jgi:hypothetical protein
MVSRLHSQRFFNTKLGLLVSAKVEWRTEQKLLKLLVAECRAQVGINKSQKINVFTGLITLNNNSLPSPPGIYIYIYA